MLGVLTLGALLVTMLHSTVVQLPAETVSAAFAECADGIDNDNNGKIDYPQDPKCQSLQDDSEGDPVKAVFISLSDGLAIVTPNGHMTYTIGLRTERSTPMITDVYFQMPHQTSLISASDGGYRSDELIVWKNVSVNPGSLRSLYVNINVSPDAEVDTLLVAEARADGERATDTTRIELDDDAIIGQEVPMHVSVSDGKTYAQPYEVLNYTVSVRNPTNKERTVDVRLQIPTDTALEYASGGYSENRQAVTWDDQVIGPKGAREYKVAVRIAKNAAEFYIIRTRASVGLASATDTTTVHTGLAPKSIQASITDGLDEIVQGALVTYDIAIVNSSSQLATEIDVNNALPSYMEFVDASEGGYWTGKNVRWEGLTVSPHGSRALRVTGRVRSDAPLGERLKSTISVSNFQSVDYTTVGSAVSGAGLEKAKNVLITKFADKNEVQPGDTVTYTVRLQNVTGKTLRNVLVEDRMNSPYIRITNAESGVSDGNGITWTIPTLAPGQDWTVQYQAQIDYRAPHGVTIPNIVTVSGEGMETVSLAQRIYTSRIEVISNLPPTGAAFDALFLLLTGVLGGMQTFAQRRKLLL